MVCLALMYLDVNIKIIDDIVKSIIKYAPDAIVLLVSNPIDSLTYEAFKRSGFDRHRIIGQAGVLDSTRMASFIAMESGLSAKDIDAMVLGGHGDTMVPMIRFTTISGIGIEHLLEADLIDAIVHGRKRIMPAVAILQGEYGLNDMAMGMPCVLGDKGVESIIELPLNEAEQKMFDESAAAIRKDIDSLA